LCAIYLDFVIILRSQWFDGQEQAKDQEISTDDSGHSWLSSYPQESFLWQAILPIDIDDRIQPIESNSSPIAAITKIEWIGCSVSIL
ncbi:MAG TPA: hypothetical protein VK798_02345, partial [Alloacidobacterium sp.]|nr:hypothetical protein [Alloacidobacterium sp.]